MCDTFSLFFVYFTFFSLFLCFILDLLLPHERTILQCLTSFKTTALHPNETPTSPFPSPLVTLPHSSQRKDFDLRSLMARHQNSGNLTSSALNPTKAKLLHNKTPFSCTHILTDQRARCRRVIIATEKPADLKRHLLNISSPRLQNLNRSLTHLRLKEDKSS